MSEPPQADHAASVKKLSRVSRHRRRFDPMIRSFFPALFCLLSSAHAIEVEVSPMGPIRTLTEARDAVRKARTEDPSQEATITIRADVLTLTSPLLLEAQDSNLLLHGQSDKESVLQGAPLVTGWGPHEGNIVKANLLTLLPKGFRPRQLFCDGDRQILARYPNHNPKDPLYGGWAFVAPFPGTGAPPRAMTGIENSMCTQKTFDPGRIPKMSKSIFLRNMDGGTLSNPSLPLTQRPPN